MLLAVAVLAGLLAACGSDDDGSADETASSANAAFLRAMIPHHESAIEMAKLAVANGEHPQVRQLASNIVRTQGREIRRIRRIYRLLFGVPVKPNAGAHMQLGLSADAAGMSHGDMAELEGAKPFDKAFIDAMVPHHQGAIRMARAVKLKSEDVEIGRLADGIIQAQATEISDMNSWRESWYGARSPAGGVPKDAGADALPPEDQDSGEHMGH